MTGQGRYEEGIALIKDSLTAVRETGSEMGRPYNLNQLADAFIHTNHLDEALGALTEALAMANEREDHCWEAESYRLKGELLLKRHESNVAEGQDCLERAIEVAQKQGAKSLELRATTSLARLRERQGKRDEARARLADIYNWFTEGFDTADLKDAKALLEELKE
jgi:predicted ATPase